MLEYSPYSNSCLGQCLDFELRLSIDDCPIQIRPERTPRGATVHWECGNCGHQEALSANLAWSTELLVASAKVKAIEHIMRTHPGPETRALFESF